MCVCACVWSFACSCLSPSMYAASSYFFFLSSLSPSILPLSHRLRKQVQANANSRSPLSSCLAVCHRQAISIIAIIYSFPRFPNLLTPTHPAPDSPRRKGSVREDLSRVITIPDHFRDKQKGRAKKRSSNRKETDSTLHIQRHVVIQHYPHVRRQVSDMT